MVTTTENAVLGGLLRRQRLMIPMTLRSLSALSGVSASHISRIEKGDRFPSASVLKQIASPLGFEEEELFSLAGYLSSPSTSIKEGIAGYSGGRLDPYVSRILSAESVEVQHAVIGILSILKALAGSSKVQ